MKKLKAIYTDSAEPLSDKNALPYVQGIIDRMDDYQEITFCNEITLYAIRSVLIQRDDIELTVDDGTNEHVCTANMRVDYQTLKELPTFYDDFLDIILWHPKSKSTASKHILESIYLIILSSSCSCSTLPFFRLALSTWV